MVIVKKLTETDGTMSIILWFTLWTTIATFPFAASQWVWPEAEDYFWLFVMGTLGSIGHLAAVSGFKIADASSVMPMDFLRLVWISLFGFLFFWRNTRGLDPDWCRSDFSRQRFVDDSFQILNPPIPVLVIEVSWIFQKNPFRINL